MQTEKRLSNLQHELLKMFSLEIHDDQLLEIKSLLAQYFANKITQGVDELFENKGWGQEKISDWSKEHMRLKSEKNENSH